MMQYLFPNDFIFGTSTAATQIETAFEHDWQGVRSKDGFIFDRTTDHELRFVFFHCRLMKPFQRTALKFAPHHAHPIGRRYGCNYFSIFLKSKFMVGSAIENKSIF